MVAVPIRRRRTGAIAGLLALVLGLVAPALAQEVQVPLDRSGRVQRIDSQLASRLAIFDRYAGFIEARLFRAADSTYVLEVSMTRGGQLLRERLPMTAAGTDSLRDRISILIAEKAPATGLNQDGRALLVSMTTLLGLGFYGWAVPYATEMENSETAVGTYLVVAGASFFVPFIATARSPVTTGSTDLALYGATRGIPHGILFYQLIVGGEGTSSGNVGAAMAGSLVEGLGGFLWAERGNLKAGTTTAIGALGDFGLLEGLGVASLADYFDKDQDEAAAAVMLAGSAVGLTAGAMLAAHRSYSYGDARVMRDGMLLGTAMSVMVVDWFDTEDKTKVAAAMVGGAASLLAADRLVRDTEFNAGQSWLITLGMVGGGAIGLGTGYLFAHNGDDGTLLLTAGTGGALIGYAATYGSFLKSARHARMNTSSWRLEVSPLGLLAARALGTRGSTSHLADLPLVRVVTRF